MKMLVRALIASGAIWFILIGFPVAALLGPIGIILYLIVSGWLVLGILTGAGEKNGR